MKTGDKVRLRGTDKFYTVESPGRNITVISDAQNHRSTARTKDLTIDHPDPTPTNLVQFEYGEIVQGKSSKRLYRVNKAHYSTNEIVFEDYKGTKGCGPFSDFQKVGIDHYKKFISQLIEELNRP